MHIGQVLLECELHRSRWNAHAGYHSYRAVVQAYTENTHTSDISVNCTLRLPTDNLQLCHIVTSSLKRVSPMYHRS